MSEETEVVARDIWQQTYEMLDDVYPIISNAMNSYLRDTGCPDEATAIMTKTLVLLGIVCLLNQPILKQDFKTKYYKLEKDEKGRKKYVPVDVDECPLTKSLHSSKNVAIGFLFSVLLQKADT
jgi:hypothetical protein